MIRRREITLYDREFRDILKLVFSKEFSTEHYIRKFEKEFSKYIRTKHAIATCKGRSGMMLLLDVLNLKKGDEVILSAYNLKDLIILIQKKDLKPILVDIEEDTFNINPDLIEEKITDKTKVIIVTHMFGLPCNMKKIVKIAEEHNVKVIEDCCIAHGAEFEGKKVGSFGIGGFFSFDPIKPIGTFNGGMITTNNDGTATLIRKKMRDFPYPRKEILKKVLMVYLENFILKSPLFYLFSSLFYFKFTKNLFNKLYRSFHKQTSLIHCKYTNLQAFVGLKQLKTLDKRNDIRIRNARLLKKLLGERIDIQKINYKSKHIYYYFIVKSNNDIERIQRKLLIRGLDTSIKDEILDDCTKIVKEFSDDCSVTHSIFNSVIQIPIYENLTEKNVYRIAEILNKVW